MDDGAAVLWARRLRPRWRWWYPVLLAVVAAVGLGVGIADAREDARQPSSSFAPRERTPSPFLFVGCGAAVGALCTAMAWAPRSALTADGVLRYAAVTRRRAIDLTDHDRVVVGVAGVVAGGARARRPPRVAGGPGHLGGGETGRRVLEVRTVDERHTRQQRTMALYLPAPDIVGVADPPLHGAELDELLDALGRFTLVEIDADLHAALGGDPAPGA